MTIDKSQEYWKGRKAEDVIEYLKLYSGDEITKTVMVKCDICGSDKLLAEVDSDEGAIKIVCPNCKRERFLLDSEEYWNDCEPDVIRCPDCNNDIFNIGIGFVYRKNDSHYESNNPVKWVYIGNRCVKCGLLGSCGDWGINYAPTDNLEKNT